MRKLLLAPLVVLALGLGSVAVAPRAGAATAPGAPGVVRGLPGDRSATLTWTAPASDGGSPITGWVVTAYDEAGAIRATATFPTAATTQVLTGLGNGLTYRFRVAAVNAVGTGPQSGMPGPFGSIRVGTPLAPPALGATVAADGTVTLTWSPATSPVATPLTEVRVWHVPAGTTAPQPGPVLGGSALSATIDYLPAGTYDFLVAAGNVYGSGVPARTNGVVIALPTPRQVPSATAEAGDASATVRWTAASTVGPPVDGYRVTPTIDGQDQPPVLVGTTTSATIGGLPNGSTASFRVAARSSAGFGPERTTEEIAIGAPRPPGIVRPIATGPGSATITWSPPSGDNGSPVTAYVVTPIRDDVAEAPRELAGSSLTTTLTGLADGSRYRFLVAARNARGLGAPSPLPSLLWSVVPGSPAAPQVTATGGPRSISISWTVPDGNGAAVTGYRVFVAPKGTSALGVQPLDTTATSATVPVPSGGPYEVYVLARNARGEGLAGRASARATAQLPGRPTITSAVPGDQRATVAWARPADDGGSPITSYRITPIAAGTPLTPVTVSPTAGSTTITGLANGVDHRFEVAAVTAAGAGPPATSGVVRPGVPPAPLVVGVDPGVGAATFRWASAGDGGSPITAYEVTPYAGATALPPVTVAGTETSATVTGLRDGRTYTFRVVAQNAWGRGAPSAKGPALASPVGSPTAPGSAVATSPGAGQAQVTWTPSSPNSSPVTGYQIVASRVGAVFDFSTPVQAGPGATTATITGLRPGTYTVLVNGRNALGLGPAARSATIVVR